MHDRWGNYPTLGRMVFLTVREALHSPTHPDSKRQARRKARDLTRYGARILKQARVTSCPVTRTSKRRELALMRQRVREEREKQASLIAGLLSGRIRKVEVDGMVGYSQGFVAKRLLGLDTKVPLDIKTDWSGNGRREHTRP